ncbi:N-acetylneuraminate (7)9-O-acetyltransferase isoform X2 [Ambystoma mexicanum]|uniref:N-acetylneuraminate (7)9-O-acetyltransferase isoform X2 n=1 Tax=Ambystoma mexicanum TaxID=8296 RepID=UPI0037E78C54
MSQGGAGEQDIHAAARPADLAAPSSTLAARYRRESVGEKDAPAPRSDDENKAAKKKKKPRGKRDAEEVALLLSSSEEEEAGRSAAGEALGRQQASQQPPPSPDEGSSSRLLQSQCCPSAPARSIAQCCHGGAKMAALAYNLGKREINYHFSVRNAKLLALLAALLLAAGHGLARHYAGHDACDQLISSGRFLGGNVWQPHSCMMHKYKSSESKICLADKRITFIGDSRVRQLFFSFVKLINPGTKEDGNKHEDIPYEDEAVSIHVSTATKPHIIVLGAATWSIKIHNGSAEALTQYKANVSAVAPILEKLAETTEVYWVLQDPVNENLLSESRKMITNEKIDAYNEAAVSILNSSARNSKSKIRIFSISKLISQETIAESLDGLHIPEASRDASAMILMNAYCNNIVKPIDGSCCQPRAPLTMIQKLATCLFAASFIGYIVQMVIHRNIHRKNKTCTDLESGEEKKPATATPAASTWEVLLQSLCKLGLIMAYFYLCDRANLFMKENKFYTHSSFFIPIIYILVLGVFYIENTKETKMLNRDQTDEWKGWMQLVILIYHISGASSFLPVYMHVRVLVAAYLFQTGYGHFSFFWLKGDFGFYRVCQVVFRLNFLVVVLCIVMDRPYQFYYFVPLVTFWFVVIYGTLAAWPQIIQKQANGNRLWNLGLLLKLAFLLLIICFLTYSQGSFEKIFSLWPVSELFELNGNVYEWWFRWKLDRYAVFHGMLFAFLYLALQKRQILSEGKGEPLFSSNISNILLFFSVLSFLTYSIWASSCRNKNECNEMHPSVSVVQILAFVLIRNIPGYARSVYSTFFAWFGKISLELFICQYHIWLAADTKGILVLIPGNPMLNIIVSTFIFVCAAHEISHITNDLAQIVVPKETSALIKRLLGIAGFLSLLLLLSSIQEKLKS